MDATVKEIAVRLQTEDDVVRSIIKLANLKVRGDGPKPAKGLTPKTYRLNDVQKIYEYLQNFEQAT